MANEVTEKHILIDSDALVALIKKDDAHFTTATRIAQEAKQKNVEFFLSQYTIAEVATVLSKKISQGIAIQFLANIHHFNLGVIATNEMHFLKAEEIFIRQKKKATSFFDCLNIAIVQLQGFEGIFSFDHIYPKNGIKFYR